MKNHVLAGLEPQAPLSYFEEICAIPHGSRNTKQISDYLVRFAQEHQLAWQQDDANNVILFKPGTPGYEDHAPVILQGHMDMVCEKDPDCSIDFTKDGLELTHDGSYIFARGTTLGGDDGIAVAYALALLASTDLPHPPLEVIITVDEEIGMLGAAAIDLSALKGRTLINMDSEEEGILTVSCAGGATATQHLPVQRQTVCGPCWKFTVDGLAGGHSGQEINKGLANAVKAMGDLLSQLREKSPFCLTCFSGGAKDNAIPRSCTATVVSMTTDESIPAAAAQAMSEALRRDFNEPAAEVRFQPVDAMGGYALTQEATGKVLALICSDPNGVQAMCQRDPSLVQTSLNLGIAQLNEDALELTFSVRSSVGKEKEALLASLQKLVEKLGGSYSQMGEYPAWEYREESPLRDLMTQVYMEMFGAMPEIQAIHAGLECGLLGSKLPGLDCVSFGPEMHDIHTSREKLGIASVGRMWLYLLEILRRL